VKTIQTLMIKSVIIKCKFICRPIFCQFSADETGANFCFVSRQSLQACRDVQVTVISIKLGHFIKKKH